MVRAGVRPAASSSARRGRLLKRVHHRHHANSPRRRFRTSCWFSSSARRGWSLRDFCANRRTRFAIWPSTCGYTYVLCVYTCMRCVYIVCVCVCMQMCKCGCVGVVSGGGSPLHPETCRVDRLTDWLTDWRPSVRPSVRSSVTLSVAPCRGSRQWQGVASDTMATTGCDCLVGGAAAPRYPRSLCPSTVMFANSVPLMELSSSLVAATTSQQHPRRPSVAAPLGRIEGWRCCRCCLCRCCCCCCCWWWWSAWGVT
jgi:hypothetical protein